MPLVEARDADEGEGEQAKETIESHDLLAHGGKSASEAPNTQKACRLRKQGLEQRRAWADQGYCLEVRGTDYGLQNWMPDPLIRA